MPYDELYDQYPGFGTDGQTDGLPPIDEFEEGDEFDFDPEKLPDENFIDQSDETYEEGEADYYVQDLMVQKAETFLMQNGIDYTAPTTNPEKDHEPSLVIVPARWGKEKAGIVLDFYADEYDQCVIEVVGYVPKGVTSYMDDLQLLKAVNEENLDSDGPIFAVDEERRVTVRIIIIVEDDTFPEEDVRTAMEYANNVIQDYRREARDHGHFPEVEHLVLPDLPE